MKGINCVKVFVFCYYILDKNKQKNSDIQFFNLLGVKDVKKKVSAISNSKMFFWNAFQLRNGRRFCGLSLDI